MFPFVILIIPFDYLELLLELVLLERLMVEIYCVSTLLLGLCPLYIYSFDVNCPTLSKLDLVTISTLLLSRDESFYLMC
jgi:hypothetical protein